MFSWTSPLSDRKVPNDNDKENDNGDDEDVNDNNKDHDSHTSLTPVLATVTAKGKNEIGEKRKQMKENSVS